MWVHDGDLRHYPLRFSPAPWPLSTRRRGAHTFCPRRSPSRLTSSLSQPSGPASRVGCHGEVLPILWKSRGFPQTVTPTLREQRRGLYERVEPL